MLARDQDTHMPSCACVCVCVSVYSLLHRKLSSVVDALEEGGATALGPALTVAAGMATSTAAAEIVLCTDGRPNVALGALDSSGEGGPEFYVQVRGFCSECC